MDYLLERMNAAACHEVRVVTRPEKVDIVHHAHDIGARVSRVRSDRRNGCRAQLLRRFRLSDVYLDIGTKEALARVQGLEIAGVLAAARYRGKTRQANGNAPSTS